jgi:hypothetical protein
MSKTDMILRDFVYLDWERVRSLAAQIFRGIPQDATSETGKEASLSGEFEGGLLGFLKGKSGADYRYLKTENETRSLHHYVYSLVENELIKSKQSISVDSKFDSRNWTKNFFHDGQFIRVTGIVRLIDYGWTATMIEALPRMMNSALQLANLDLQKQSGQSLTPEQIKARKQRQQESEKSLKDVKILKVDQLADLIRSLYGDVIRIKVVPNKNHLENLFVGSGSQANFYDSTASLNQKYGYEIDANWVTLGQINLSEAQDEPMPIPIGNQMEDGFEKVVFGLNNVVRIASSPKFPAISFTPISIYRTVQK